MKRLLLTTFNISSKTLFMVPANQTIPLSPVAHLAFAGIIAYRDNFPNTLK